MAAGPYVEPNPPHDVAARLQERFPDAGLAVEEFRGELTVVVPRDRLIEVARALRADPGCPFEMLTGVAGLHFLEGEFEHEVVFILYSLSRNRRLSLKVRLKPGEGVASLTGVWPGANWPEREQFDLVGIRFE